MRRADHPGPTPDRAARADSESAPPAAAQARPRGHASPRPRGRGRSARRHAAEAAQRLLADAGKLLGASVDQAETLMAVARLIVPALADWFVLHLVDESGQIRPAVTMHVDPAKVALAQDYNERFPPAEGGAATVVRTGQPLLVPSVTDDMLREAGRDEEHLRLMREVGIVSAIVVPVSARERVLGALSLVAAESGRRYDERDLRLAQELAERIGLALDNAQLLEQARAAADRTARLQAVTAGLARALAVEEVAETVVREGMAAFQARDGILCLLSEDQEWLEIVRAVGLPAQTAREWRRFSVQDDLPLSEAVRSGEPVFLESKAAVQARYPSLRVANQRARTESWIGLPLLSESGALGGLAFGFTEARRFTDEDRSLGIALSQQCVQALERARAVERERTSRAAAESAADWAARLQRVTSALAMAITTEDVAHAMLDHGLAAVDATAGVVCRLNADATAIDHVWALGYPAEGLEWFRRKALRVALPPRDVVQTGAPVWVESPEAWLARYQPPRPGMEVAPAAAALPLRVGDRLVGIMVLRFRAPRSFPEEERARVLSVASQCAQALERARLYEAEREARARADEANRAKSEFLAVMSHELRTPLNAIAGYAELLELGVHGPVTDAQRDAITRIQASQRHLLGLINDVLSFARIDAGQVQLDLRVIDVHASVDALHPLIEPQIQRKGLRFEHRDCQAPALSLADEDKVRQILLNLLSNAMKFTPPGGRVAVTCAAENGTVRVVVADSGPGIPAGQLERIFEPFVQLDAGRTRVHEGTGLGLAISRDLARAMGGDIAVDSTVGAGSAFTLTLPRAKTT